MYFFEAKRSGLKALSLREDYSRQVSYLLYYGKQVDKFGNYFGEQCAERKLFDTTPYPDSLYKFILENVKFVFNLFTNKPDDKTSLKICDVLSAKIKERIDKMDAMDSWIKPRRPNDDTILLDEGKYIVDIINTCILNLVF